MSGIGSSTSSSTSSSSTTSIPTSTGSEYGKLLKVYRAITELSKKDTEEQFVFLPNAVRNNIFGKIYNIAGSPKDVEWNWGELHVFDSLPRLQQAIQQVAFEAFDSLSTNNKNYVTGRVYIHSSTPDLRGVENLLQSLDDCFTRDLTPELSAILNSWATELAPGENRQEAVKRIIGFLNSKAETTLDLSNLRLKTLPPIFNSDPFINRLTKLNLEKNSLSKLPPEIGKLQKLEWLEVFQNQLTTLPPEIGKLQKLIVLSLRSNQLTALPPEIGLLQELGRLSLNFNPTLRGVPMEMLHLPHDCHIYLDAAGLIDLEKEGFFEADEERRLNLCQIFLVRAGFSDAVLRRLREACNIPGYHGPRISFSIRDDAAPRAARSTEQLLQELFTLSGSAKKEFPKLLGSTETNKDNLNLWLNRLSDTADYKRGGALQKAYAGKILKYLQAAEDNEKFREVFFAVIEGAAETCGDRVALSIFHVSTAFKLATCNIKNIKELSDLLIKEMWPVEMLEKIARKKVSTLSFYDEIEVYLVYLVKLREKLGMPIDIEGMLYDHFANTAVTPKDLDEAAKFVQKQQNDSEKKCRFLIGQDKWIEALKTNYADKLNEIDSEIATELDKADCDDAKLGQIRDEKLIALTAWVLLDNNTGTSCGPLGSKHSEGKMEE